MDNQQDEIYKIVEANFDYVGRRDLPRQIEIKLKKPSQERYSRRIYPLLDDLLKTFSCETEKQLQELFKLYIGLSKLVKYEFEFHSNSMPKIYPAEP